MLVIDDYVPGTPNQILQLADRIQGTAQRAEDAQHELANVLHNACGLPWQGTSAEAFHGLAASMPDDLGLMASSYFRTAEALRRYGNDVQDLQRRVARSIARAQQAQADRDAALRLRDAASARARDLQVELATLAVESAGLAAGALVGAVAPGVAEHAAAQHAAVEQRRADVAGELSRANAERQRQAASASTSDEAYRAELRLLAGCRDERSDREHECAGRIRVALEGDIRNRSLIQQLLLDPISHGGKGAIGALSKLAADAFNDFAGHGGLAGAGFSAAGLLVKQLPNYPIGKALGQIAVGRAVHGVTGNWIGAFWEGNGMIGAAVRHGAKAPQQAFVGLTVLLDVGEALHYRHRDDTKYWSAIGHGVGTAGAYAAGYGLAASGALTAAGGAAIAAPAAGVAAAAATAFGAGWVIGEGINMASEHVFGKTVSAAFADVRHDRAFGDLEARSESLARIDRSMSAEELRRRSEELSSISAQVRERSERMQHPIDSLLHGHLPW